MPRDAGAIKVKEVEVSTVGVSTDVRVVRAMAVLLGNASGASEALALAEGEAESKTVGVSEGFTSGVEITSGVCVSVID